MACTIQYVSRRGEITAGWRVRKRVNQVMVAFRKAGWVASDANYHITLLNQPALIRVSETAAIESYE